MIAYFGKEIVALLDGLLDLLEGHGDPEACSSSLQAAADAHRQSHLRFQALRATIVPDETLAKLCTRQSEFLARRESLYQQIEIQLDSGLLEAIPESSRELQEISHQIALTSLDIERGRAQQPRLAQHPALDEVLKISNSVLEGRAEFSLLPAYVREIVTWYKSKDEEAKFFLHFYKTETDMVAEWPRLTETYQNGVGALMHAVESKDKAALTDAVTLLGGAAKGMDDFGTRIKGLRESEGMSTDPLLDAFAQVSRKASRGRAKAKDVHRRLQQMQQFKAVQTGGCEEFLRTQLVHPKSTLFWERELQPRLDIISASIEKALGQDKMAALERTCQEIFRTAEAFRQSRDDWMGKGPQWRSFAADPQWESLREALSGWFLGVVPRPSVTFLLAEARQSWTELQSKISQAPEVDRDSLNQALEKPKTVFLALDQALQTGERVHLANIVADWETGLDRWIWAKDSLKDLSSAEPVFANMGEVKTHLRRCQDEAAKAVEKLTAIEEEAPGDVADTERFAEFLEGFMEDLDAFDEGIQGLLELPDEAALSEHAEQIATLTELAENLVNRQNEAARLGH